MNLQINGHSLLECDEDDLKGLIDDPFFRENEYIDYKENFAHLIISDKVKKEEKKVEFRNDVCSFANSEGGFLVYGIKEIKGEASEIIGIDIQNNDTDKFELDRRTDLQPINPRIPYLQFNFISLQNGKYVVIIYVKHDSFAPYTQLVNQSNYKFFKRAGNGKTYMTYTEIKNMFNNSISLDKDVYLYRKERIDYYSSIYSNNSRFLLIHVIPETFLDKDHNINAYVLQYKDGVQFSSLFSNFYCHDKAIPCVNGLRFIPSPFERVKSEGHITNNGIVECYYPLDEDLDNYLQKYPNGYFPRDLIWDNIQSLLTYYYKIHERFIVAERIFLCISIIGCKDVVTNTPETDGLIFYTGTIDRNNVICEPVVVNNISNESEFQRAQDQLHLDYLLSIGVKGDETMNLLIKELYNK